MATIEGGGVIVSTSIDGGCSLRRGRIISLVSRESEQASSPPRQ
jgi:hypothetical protein